METKDQPAVEFSSRAPVLNIGGSPEREDIGNQKSNVESRATSSWLGLVLVFITSLVPICWPGMAFSDDQQSGALQPRLLIESAVFNFGTVRQGDTVSTSFKFKNAGTADLVIQRVVAACGCTTTAPTKDKLAPGESTEIKVSFDTSGFSGEKLKTVRIFSNDPDQPSALITLQGVVEPDVLVEPARLLFPEIVRGESAQGAAQEFSISVRRGASVRLGAALQSSNNFKVIELPGGSDISKRFRVVLSPDLAPGELRERVTIPLLRAGGPLLRASGLQPRAGGPPLQGGSSALNVPVLATIRGTIELRPIALSFGVIEGNDPLEKIARVESLSTSPIAIESVSSDNPAVIAVARPARGDGRQYEIVVTVDPGKLVSDLKASITIATSRKSEPALVLGVFGIRSVP